MTLEVFFFQNKDATSLGTAISTKTDQVAVDKSKVLLSTVLKPDGPTFSAFVIIET